VLNVSLPILFLNLTQAFKSGHNIEQLIKDRLSTKQIILNPNKLIQEASSQYR